MKNIKKRLIGWTLGLALSLGVGIGIASNTHSEIAGVEAAGETKTLIIDGSKLTSTATTADSTLMYGDFNIAFSKGAKTQKASGTNKFAGTEDAILIGKEGSYIYNVTPIGTKITKFEIYANKGASTKVTVGVNFSAEKITEYNASSANTFTEKLSSVDHVYDASSKLPTDAKYFWYQVTNANNSQVMFRITYENVSRTAKSVTIDPSELNVTEGEIGYTKQLNAVVVYNESTETDDKVVWSSDSTEAIVSETGLLTLNSTSGSAKITATSRALGTDGQPVAATLNVTWSGLVEPIRVIFSEKGLSNGADATEVAIDSITKVTFNQGTASNSPKYYNTGEAVRVYPGGNFKVSITDTSKRLVSITLGFGSGDFNNSITTDNPSFTSPVWTGSAQDVTFTIRGKKDHRRIASITVIYEDFADTSAADALAFGTSFLNKTAKACADGTKDNSEALKTAWATLKTEFNALSDSAKKLVKDAFANNVGTDLEKAMARYDHIVKRYSTAHTEINDFIGRGVTASLTNQLFKANTTNNIMVVSLITCASAAAIGSFFFIRKRKEQN